MLAFKQKVTRKKTLYYLIFHFQDCAEEEEVPVFSRQRRDISAKNEKVKSEQTGVNTESFLLNKINELEKRLEGLEGSCRKNETKESVTTVCIDFNGKVRQDEEVWEYPFHDEDGKCVQCTCQVNILSRKRLQIC